MLLTGCDLYEQYDFYDLEELFIVKHQFPHFLLVLFLFFQIEHGTKDVIPNRAADAKALVLILVMMEMMIAPKRFHPFKRRVPGMNSVMHAAIHQITQNKSGEKHESVLPSNQIHD